MSNSVTTTSGAEMDAALSQEKQNALKAAEDESTFTNAFIIRERLHSYPVCEHCREYLVQEMVQLDVTQNTPYNERKYPYKLYAWAHENCPVETFPILRLWQDWFKDHKKRGDISNQSKLNERIDLFIKSLAHKFKLPDEFLSRYRKAGEDVRRALEAEQKAWGEAWEVQLTKKKAWDEAWELLGTEGKTLSDAWQALNAKGIDWDDHTADDLLSYHEENLCSALEHHAKLKEEGREICLHNLFLSQVRDWVCDNCPDKAEEVVSICDEWLSESQVSLNAKAFGRWASEKFLVAQ